MALSFRLSIRIIVVCFLLFVGQTTQAWAQTPAKPNIVLIMADDLGYECVGANGGTSYRTPNLDRLAKTGIRFEHCYSQPLCTPSRVKLMTGIYNVRNYEKFANLPKSQKTFGNFVKSNGYTTCCVGKWQLEGDPRAFGFDQHCLWYLNGRKERYPNPGFEINGKFVDFENGEYGPDVACDFACDFIEKNKSKPFLVYYPMILTHCPFCPTPDSGDWDPKDKGSKTYKGKAKYFGDMVTYMDKLVGRIEKQLESSGVRENTLIMFIGDNGTDKPIVSMMGDKKVTGGKGKMTDAGTRVPFIANWPGTIPAGLVSQDLVDFSDFVPTIAEATSTRLPNNIKFDGQSFMPQLKGHKGNPRKWIYCWYSRNGGANGQEWVRNQRFKLYRDGRLFDIQNDVLEKSPIETTNQSTKLASTRKMLTDAIMMFNDARPAAVSAVGKKQKKKNN